jgi:hypothetical protein
VFKPALTCDGGDPEGESVGGVLTKLTLRKMGEAEWFTSRILFKGIQDAKAHLDSETSGDSPENYFIIPHKICTPSYLEPADLENFDRFCKYPLQGLNAEDVNTARANNKIKVVQLRDGGRTLEGLVHSDDKILSAPFWDAMIRLLEKGVVPVNRQNVLHHDVKYNNVVYDDTATSGGDNRTYLRLIDCDRVLRLARRDDIESMQEAYDVFRSEMQQPIAYAFLCDYALDRINRGLPRRATSRSLYFIIERLHPAEETKAEDYVGIDDTSRELHNGTVKYTGMMTQITTILERFYDDSTHAFDWSGYAALLTANYDVYGWLGLINYCMRHHERIFSDYSAYSFYGPALAMKEFLRHYMYDPEVLARPYNIREMIATLTQITGVPDDH